jgi:ABC-type nitrate/sulfonate/bicarbonate transport system ATPase subunit
MNTQAVDIRDLRVQYGNEVVFESMNLEVQEGEFVCLLGPSGCGKSTMLKIIGELTDHHGGSVAVFGEPTEKAWSRLAYVFQAPRLVPWRTALGNIVLGMQMRGIRGTKAELRAQALEAMEIVGITHLADRPGHVLSGGEQQRVSIARALAVKPQVLLMDEPFSALDVQTRRQLRKEIVALWERTGLTIVFVTHDVDEALIVGSRIVLFSPKPTTLLSDMPVTLAKPVDPTSPAFLAEHDRIVAMFGNNQSAIDELTGVE